MRAACGPCSALRLARSPAAARGARRALGSAAALRLHRRPLPRGNALVSHSGLEPRTSRRQTGLLLTRSSLALDRTPGWEAGRLNQLTDWAVSDQTNRPVICEYKADGAWLWRKWRGTVLSITLVPVLVSMGFGVAIDLAARFGCDATWPLLAVPPPEEELIQSLNGEPRALTLTLTLTLSLTDVGLSIPTRSTPAPAQ